MSAWLSQSPGLILIENLWQNWKTDVHAFLCNMADVNREPFFLQFYLEAALDKNIFTQSIFSPLYRRYMTCLCVEWMSPSELTEMAVTLTASTVEWLNRYHKAEPISVVAMWRERPETVEETFSTAFAAIWWTTASSCKRNTQTQLQFLVRV